MIIDPLPNEHRDIFHGPANRKPISNCILKAPTLKAFDILKQHPKHIVSLYYKQGVNAIIGHLIVKMHCSKCYKNTRKTNIFDNLVPTNGRYG